jgi:hypothetical protein
MESQTLYDEIMAILVDDGFSVQYIHDPVDALIVTYFEELTVRILIDRQSGRLSFEGLPDGLDISFHEDQVNASNKHISAMIRYLRYHVPQFVSRHNVGLTHVARDRS